MLPLLLMVRLIILKNLALSLRLRVISLIVVLILRVLRMVMRSGVRLLLTVRVARMSLLLGIRRRISPPVFVTLPVLSCLIITLRLTWVMVSWVRPPALRLRVLRIICILIRWLIKRSRACIRCRSTW